MKSLQLDNRNTPAFKFSTESLNSRGKVKSEKNLFSKVELLAVETEIRPTTIGKKVDNLGEAKQLTSDSAKKIEEKPEQALSTHGNLDLEKVFDLLA